MDIYEASLELNGLIRQFNPQHDDLEKPVAAVEADSCQMSLLEGL